MIAPTADIEERRQEAAEALGIDVEQVQIHQLEIDAMRNSGLLIDLDVHGISMLYARVSMAEMGISANDVRAKRLRTGSKDLFPDHTKRLRSLEQRARTNLAQNSYPASAFGPWRWLPWTAYPEFIEKHKAILEELRGIKEDLLDWYEDIRAENAAYFEEVALRAWKALLGSYGPGTNVVVLTKDGYKFERGQLEEFTRFIVDRALAKMPTPEEIESQVRIDYQTAILFSTSEIAAEQAALAQAQAAQAQAQLAQAEAAQAEFELTLEQHSAEQKAQAEIEAYRRAEIEHAREQLEQWGSPLQEALDTLRAAVHNAVRDLLQGIEKNDGFRGRASTRAAGLLDRWKQLNGGLLKDDELEAELEALNAAMQRYQVSEARSATIGDIEATMTSIITMTAASAERIAASASSRAATLEF
jgi:hypothetical protein